MKKNVKIMSVFLSALLALGGCAGGGGQTPADKGSQDAQSQAAASGTEQNTELGGRVIIYTSMYEEIIEAMDAKLEEVFPNIDVEFFQGGTGTLQTKIAAEMDSGTLGCDMLMVAEPSYSLELKEAGILHPYQFSEADKLITEYDSEGYWYPVRILNMVLAYNPDKNEKSSLPDSFADFATSESVKDSISMGNPLSSGTAYAAIVALLDKYGEDYYGNLANQHVVVESGSVALTKLETGECKEIMILEESVLKKREEENSSLEVIYPTDGVVSVPSTIMIVDEEHSANRNTAACEAIEEWFLSLEGQKYIVAGWMHSVRSDYPSAPYDAIPTSEIISNSMKVDWEKSYKEREQIRTLFQEHVTVSK